jgi:hypothetical protein
MRGADPESDAKEVLRPQIGSPEREADEASPAAGGPYARGGTPGCLRAVSKRRNASAGAQR